MPQKKKFPQCSRKNRCATFWPNNKKKRMLRKPADLTSHIAKQSSDNMKMLPWNAIDHSEGEFSMSKTPCSEEEKLTFTCARYFFHGEKGYPPISLSSSEQSINTARNKGYCCKIQQGPHVAWLWSFAMPLRQANSPCYVVELFDHAHNKAPGTQAK